MKEAGVFVPLLFNSPKFNLTREHEFFHNCT